ncbi:MAG: EAL domain-containing protein [Nitriliruptoraceae bacterium]|nr:EAL domain-containing protein [Nitriliruptoraceae bacterium]
MTACGGNAVAASEDERSELEGRAHQTLELARRRGHGSVVDDRAVQRSVGQVTPERATRSYGLLRAGALRVRYQPITSLWTEAVMGYEDQAAPATGYGFGSAGEARTVAAQLGSGAELDVVGRDAIFEDGPGFDMVEGAELFVPIAPGSLGHRSLRTASLRASAARAGLDPGQIVWQLSEGELPSRTLLLDEASRLVDAGFRVALDRAGHGRDLATIRAVPCSLIELAPDMLAGSLRDPLLHDAQGTHLGAPLAEPRGIRG